jgi:ribosomal protein L35AE/L33A
MKSFKNQVFIEVSMKGTIMNYRGSHKSQRPKQMIIQPEGCNTKESAAKLTGKKVIWTTSTGKIIQGEIKQPHGNKGAVRVHFTEKGLPGQSLGTEVEIV